MYRFLTILLIIGLTFNVDIFATESITIQKDVKTLASDEFRGRKPGDMGIEKAADYIENEFRSIGLDVFPTAETEFEVVASIQLGDGNSFEVNGTKYELSKDYTPMSFTANAEISTEAVFVGYGLKIDTKELQWNSYQNVILKDKWAIMLIGDPENDNPESKFAKFSQPRLKVLMAQEQGAAGVVFVQGMKINKKDKLLPLAFDKSVSKADIPVINITRDVANKLLEEHNKTISDLETNIDSLKKSIALDINKDITAKTNVIPQKVKTRNVAAMLNVGAEDYFVIGAHYDHLGMGGPGSGSRKPDTVAVHNGADDNASGTAGVIELARKLNSFKNELKTNYIFVAFSAEEMGVLGSKDFVQSDLISGKNIKAMINMDMIGRLNEEKSLVIGGTGTAKEYDELIDNAKNPDNLTISKSPEGFGASDHSPFYAENIPVLFFTTGAHEDYHKPNDDEEFINYDGMDKVIDYIFDMTKSIDGLDKLTFQEAGPQFKRGGGKYKVTLGFMPDFASQGKYGVGVGGVTKGSPAEMGGMQKGDRIVAVEGKETKDIYAYMARLNELEPGQIITVDILRNDKKMVLIIQL